MKKNYNAPIMERCRLQSEDILSASENEAFVDVTDLFEDVTDLFGDTAE